MTAAAPTVGSTELPSALPSALTVSRPVADHDLVARIARGENLLRRAVPGRPHVIAFARDLAEWSGHNRDLLAKRFASRAVADAYSSDAEPFVVPASDISVAAQVEVLRRQLHHQVEWLRALRTTVPERDEPAASRDDPRHLGLTRSPVVLAATASRMAVSVVGAVARATGVLPIVIEGHHGQDRSLLQVAEQCLPPGSVAVVVVESSDPGSLIALGYVAGALGGPDDVIVVCAPGLPAERELDEFATVTVGAGDGWRRELTRLLERAGFRASDVVSMRL